MAPHRPSLSLTLPLNFEYHYNDTDHPLPKTPEPREEAQSAVDPPAPPRPHFKVRRKRTTISGHQPGPATTLDMSDTVIPSIELEMPEATTEVSSPVYQPTPSDDGLLAPLPTFQRLVTPPKTPAPRANASFSSPVESSANEWALINDSRHKLQPAFQRSASICSSFSDSSVSSCGSSAFSAPHGGSCTSPDSETTDPFLEDDLPVKLADEIVHSPDTNSSPIAKRPKTHRGLRWTQAMDDHLWMTYLQYLSDPRVTPFKMLPGTSPPLGVCSRVASKARRTWSSHRASTPAALDAIMASDRMREGSPDTIRPDAKDIKQPQWPRGEGATRRRLRTLCKRKPSLSAHYQRLLRTRSPSPFQSSSSNSANRSSEPPSAAFSSRDMNVSLAAATAPSMQPEGPLAQLASDDEPRPQTQPKRNTRPADWFARIPRSQAHQKSLSLQSGLNLNTSANQPGASLASPFDDDASRFHMLQSMAATKSLGRTEFKSGKVPALDSPVELSGAPTLPRSLKRRFRSDEEKPKRPAIQDVFGPSESEETGIVRNRGFTVGAARATDNLAKLFTPLIRPAPTVDHEMAEAPAVPAMPDLSHLGPPGSRSAPRRLAEPVPRLGSPFTEAPNRQFNTFPRTYIPSASNPQPFQQRLRELQASCVTDETNPVHQDVAE